MTHEEKELLKAYLEEIRSVASTCRVGRVLVSPHRALDEIVFNVEEALKLLNKE